MNPKEIINKKSRAYEMHQKNTHRLSRIFGAKVGMMVGVLFSAIGAIVIALATGNFGLDVGATLTGVGVTMAGADYIANLALQSADRKARKELQKEFPELTRKGKLHGYACMHSREVVAEIEQMERDSSPRKAQIFKGLDDDSRYYDAEPVKSVISKEEEMEM